MYNIINSMFVQIMEIGKNIYLPKRSFVLYYLYESMKSEEKHEENFGHSYYFNSFNSGMWK